MDKDLLQYLGINKEDIITNCESIDSDKTFSDEYEILNVKVFSAGVLANKVINN